MQAAFYIGTHKEFSAGLFNRVVRALDCAIVSHMEIVFIDGSSASASFMDGGVRRKIGIDFSDPNKWILVDLPSELEMGAWIYFSERYGKAYDLLANLWQWLGFVRQSTDKYMCSEIGMGALQFPEPWRIRPQAAMMILLWRYRELTDNNRALFERFFKI